MQKVIWPVLMGFVFVVVIAASIGIGSDIVDHYNTAPAISYGAPNSVYLKFKRDDPKPVEPLTIPQGGSPVFICFDDLTWMRPIGYTLTVWFLDANGRRDDFDEKLVTHHIYPAAKMGPFPKKCRTWNIPGGLDPGPHVLTGQTAPTDSSSRAAAVDFPRIPFVVK